jgi:hypothetical protein
LFVAEDSKAIFFKWLQLLVVFSYRLYKYAGMSLPVFSRVFNAANQEVGLISHGWSGVDSRYRAKNFAMGAVVNVAEMIGKGEISAQDVAHIDVEEPGSRDEIYSFTRDELVEICKQTMASRPDWARLRTACPIVFPEMQ